MTLIAERLKFLRKEKKLTQKEIAEQIGIKRNTYSDWETGKNEPSLEKLIVLADFFEVSLDWLAGRDK